MFEIEFLEMRGEAQFVLQQAIVPHDATVLGIIREEISKWRRLLDAKYIDRTLIGVFIMFFQREQLSRRVDIQ